MVGLSADPTIQARATGLAYRLLAACVLILAVFGVGLMADGLTVGGYRLSPVESWRGASLVVGGLVAAVVAAEVVRVALTRVLTRRVV